LGYPGLGVGFVVSRRRGAIQRWRLREGDVDALWVMEGEAGRGQQTLPGDSARLPVGQRRHHLGATSQGPGALKKTP